MLTPKIDFDIYAIHALPPKKRKSYFIAWFKTLLSQNKYIYEKFRYTIDGLFDERNHIWDSSTSYNEGDIVLYKKKIYKSKRITTNNIPDVVNSQYWYLISDNFIGTKERCRYRPMRLVLEWALNKYFCEELDLNSLVGFRQPDDPITPTRSDIYIEYVTQTFSSFLIYDNNIDSSKIYDGFSSGYIFDDENFSTATSYQFSVNIPSSVYSDINPDSNLAEKIVREFIDKYISSGTSYIIQTY